MIAVWRKDREGWSVDALRLGMGVLWALNLIFVVAPGNQFFSTFRAATLSFAPSTLGGRRSRALSRPTPPCSHGLPPC